MAKLLHWCSGVDTLLITKASPQDRGRYAMLGVFILFTATLSGLSMFFMAQHLMPSVLHCAVAASLWALFIFSIDRYLAISITSFKAYLHPSELKAKSQYAAAIEKEQGQSPEKAAVFLSPKAPPGYLFSTISRLLVAVFLSVVISIPVKLSMFEREINGFLSQENRTQTSGFFSSDPQVTSLKQERDKIAFEIRELREEIQHARDAMDLRYEQMKDETDGKGSSKTPGFGRYYEQTKAAYEQAKAVWQSTKSRNEPMIAQLNARDHEAQQDIKAQTQVVQEISQTDDGLLNRYRALTAIAKDDTQITLTLWLISALFVFIEAFPVMTKASSKRDSYELLLARMAFDRNASALEEYYNEKQNQFTADSLNPSIVPNQYRTYLIMLGVLLGVMFVPLYRHLNQYDGLLTPTLVMFMFAPLLILLTFIVIELAVIRSRILWQSLKPQQDLNFSIQALMLLLAPTGVILYLVMQGLPKIPFGQQSSYPTDSILASHASFWVCWGAFYLIIIINIMRQRGSEDQDPELIAQRQLRIKETDERLKNGRKAYRDGSASLYTLAGVCAFCSFLLYVKLPLTTPKSIFWALQLAFTLIPLAAVFIYGVNVRVPLSAILCIANSRAKKAYTVSVFFATTTAATLCLLYLAEEMRAPLINIFNQSTVMSVSPTTTKPFTPG